MFVAKAWYLTWTSAAACIVPFLAVIFRRAALSERDIGIIQAIKPFVQMIGASLGGSISDTWRVHKPMLLITSVLSASIRLMILTQTTFIGMLVLTLAADFIGGPIQVIVDSVVLATVETEAGYAQHRLWGAIGWGLSATIAGVLVSHFGLMSVAVMSAVFATASLIPAAKLPTAVLDDKLQERGKQYRSSVGTIEDDEEQQREPLVLSNDDTSQDETGSPNAASENSAYESIPEEEQLSFIDDTIPRPEFWQGVGQILTNPEALIFLWTVFVFGYCIGNIDGFLFLYLDDLGGSETLMGLTLASTCLAETVVFYYTGEIVAKLGPERCFHVVFLALFVRLVSYATLAWWPSVWLVLIVELLHGLTFGLSWAVGAATCNRISPPGLEATTQSIYQGVFTGLGVGLGGLAGGIIYQARGPQIMYVSASGVLLAGWIIRTICTVCFFARGTPQTSHGISEDVEQLLGDDVQTSIE